MGVDLRLPLVNQLVGGANYRPPTDGAPDNNSGWDCGEAVFCSIVSYFGGPTLNPDEVKDEVLGPGATNAPSSMDSYGALAARYGLAITRVAGDPATLLARARAEIATGHPVVILIPSMWGEEPPPAQGVGSLHFVALEADTGAGLDAMNPWGGFVHWGSYFYWQERIRDGAIWIFSKDEEGVREMLDINNAVVQKFFYETAAGAWHCRQTGQEVGGNQLALYRQMSAPGQTLAGLSMLGQPKTGLVYGSGWGVQLFERGAIAWDPQRKLDDPPGAQGDYYLAHVDSGKVLELLEGDLGQQLAAAKSQLATVQAQDASDKAAASAAEAADATDKAAATKAEADLAAAQKSVADLTAQVATLERELAQAQSEGKTGIAVVEAIRAALAA